MEVALREDLRAASRWRTRWLCRLERNGDNLIARRSAANGALPEPIRASTWRYFLRQREPRLLERLANLIIAETGERVDFSPISSARVVDEPDQATPDGSPAPLELATATQPDETTRFIRRLRGPLVGLCVLAIVLGVVGFVRWDHERQQRNRAQDILRNGPVKLTIRIEAAMPNYIYKTTSLVEAGTSISFLIIVSNEGTGQAYGVQVAAGNLPPGFDFQCGSVKLIDSLTGLPGVHVRAPSGTGCIGGALTMGGLTVDNIAPHGTESIYWTESVKVLPTSDTVVRGYAKSSRSPELFNVVVLTPVPNP